MNCPHCKEDINFTSIESYFTSNISYACFKCQYCPNFIIENGQHTETTYDIDQLMISFYIKTNVLKITDAYFKSSSYSVKEEITPNNIKMYLDKFLNLRAFD